MVLRPVVDPVLLAPVFLVAPMLAGLMFHLLLMLAVSGNGGGTPGWILHLFAGPLALVLVLGWGPRWLMVPLVAYAAVHSAAMAWMQAAFFSGCLLRAGTALLPGDLDCIINVAHRRALALPDTAAIAGAMALVALGMALASSYR